MADATTIGLLRVAVRAESGRTLARKLAVEAMLASADLRPSGLSPAAVLIVDRLAAPAGRPLALRSGAHIDPAWERAARATMASLYRRAARPWDSPAPPNCPAVLFRDEAELLACLALDISLARADARWWWRSYGRRWGSLARGVLPDVLQAWPRALPAAFRLLHERGLVEPVLRALSPSQSRQTLGALSSAFGVAPPKLAAQRPVQPGAASTVDDARPAGPFSYEVPWRAWLPASAAVQALAPESVCLLGVALTMAHAPAVAQTVGFRQAVERWWQQQGAARGQAAPLVQPASLHPAADRPGTGAQAPSRAFTQPAHHENRIAWQPADGHAATAGEEARPQARPPGQPDPAQPPATENRRGSAVEGPAASPGAVVEPDELAGDPLKLEPAQAASPASLADTLDGGIATELGGVLFLLNLMQRLDLPGCFEADWRLASQVGPWGVLELLARGLLSGLPTLPPVGNSQNFAADPLWSALAVIDGRRPDELPSGATTMPDRLSIPAGWARWLDATGDGAGQAEIASPSFAMTPHTAAPLAGPLLTGVSRDLCMWLAYVTPLLRAILSRALGEACEVCSCLLMRRGQLYVTSSHIDLVMPLESVAMPVRLAGLDFDPGWLPAFGRVVRFHYDED